MPYTHKWGADGTSAWSTTRNPKDPYSRLDGEDEKIGDQRDEGEPPKVVQDDGTCPVK